MALITCPECSELVSNLAESCPKCGANQLRARQRREKNRELERRARLTEHERRKENYESAFWVFLFTALGVIIVGLFIYSFK
jgi:ribosomal protein L40E